MNKVACFVVGMAMFALLPSKSHAIVQLRVQQVGGDVVVTGSGSANTSALIPEGSDNTWANVFSNAQVYAGPDAFSDGNVGLWIGLSGPLIVGNDPSVFENPSSGSGELFGVLANNGSNQSRLVLPDGYSSGANLTGSSIFTGSTLAHFGLTAGQISVWLWGSGANADSLRLEVLAPAPATVPAPLPIAGAAAAFPICRRLRRLNRQSPA